MATRRRRISAEAWAVFAVLVLTAIALIGDWWKGHAVLGWVIFGVIVAALGFCLYRFRGFRARLFGRLKAPFDRLINEPTERDEPTTTGTRVISVPALTQAERDVFIYYTGNRCEHPDCAERNVHEVHHIKPREEGGRNSVWNLIVLCPNHHTLAQKGVPARSTQHLWVEEHKNERYRLLRSGKWKYR